MFYRPGVLQAGGSDFGGGVSFLALTKYRLIAILLSCSLPYVTGRRNTMRGTPEGRYFAGMTALYYAHREHDNARRQVGQQNDLAATKMWFKRYVFSAILKQLSNLGSVLEQEIPPINYHIRRGTEGAGVDNLRGAISTFNLGGVLSDYDGEPTVNNSQLYVALRVTEEYVAERTATPQAIRALRRDVKEATKDEEPKYKLEPDLLRQGVIYLREKVEGTLTLKEKEKANKALE